jgi:methyl coenzyme M reductase subunit D
MINAYNHATKRPFNIKRSDLRRRYIVNRYDMEVEGKKEDLQSLRSWFIGQLVNAGYELVPGASAHYKKVVNGVRLSFTVDEVLHEIYGVEMRNPVLRITPYAY